MQNSIFKKLSFINERYQEIANLLTKPEVIKDLDRYRELAKEYASKEELVKKFRLYLKIQEDVEAARSLVVDLDLGVRSLAEEELKELLKKQDLLEQEIKILLLPKDPNDERNVFLEVRAGTGGDEAAMFAGDLLRMYSRYAENQGWCVELLSVHESERGGYKEVISRILGQDVYSHLKFESGVHRVQRVPLTEAQGRIHTSTCTVAVFPEAEAVEAVEEAADAAE